MKYREILKINETFQYSINLQFDINNINKIKEYIPTKDSCEVLEYYIDSILGNFSKSTTLIGPYGKGKSHLLLILLTILNNYNKEDEKVLNKLLDKINNINTGLYEKISLIRGKRLKYMPVIINSNYNDMNQAFLLALSESLERENLNDIVVDTYFSVALKVIKKWEQEEYKDALDKFKKCLKESNITINSLKKMLSEFNEEGYKIFKNVYSCVMHGMEFNPLINMDIIKYYKDINYKISQLGYNGMVIVFDEFSKFLEYVDNGNMMKDLKILQDFAELATRTGKSEQILLSCITHKTINEYIKNIKEDKANAFKTVEGRFKEIYFNRSIEQNFDIISQTIEKTKEFNNTYNEFYKNNIEFYNQISELPFAKMEDIEKSLYKGCFPLNPITVYSLIEISEKIAQNERTLFTFLTDDDINSFKNFIANSGEGLFCIDKIYDYFANILKKENDEQIKQIWIKSQSALSKANNHIEQKILKAIAIIKMINDVSTINTKSNAIALSLNIEEKETSAYLHEMLERGILKVKKITNTYDFTTVYNKEAVKQIEELSNKKFSEISERNVLEKVIDVNYVIPRRYNQDYNMTRYFKTIFLTQDELLKIKNFKTLFKENICDGIIINLLKAQNLEEISEKIAEINDDKVVIKIPKKDLNEDTYKALKEYESIQYIKNVNDFDEDIQREVEIIEQETIELIQKDIENKFSNNNIKNVYYRHNNYKNVANINAFISDICEEIYNRTPIINNEMVNKRELSSPAYKARNIVIDCILRKNTVLIKSITSMEATIYRATFEKRNEPNVKFVINMIKEFIKNSEEKQNFADLYNVLTEKPYGVRNGILPILTAIALEEYADNVVLYYQTKEVEIDSNNISKIIEMPEKYYIEIEKGTTDKINFIKNLLKIFGLKEEENQRTNIKILVDTMKKWILSLPRITRDLNETNNIVKQENYIKFKNELLKSDLNNNEFLFKKTKEIFALNDYTEIVTQIEQIKQVFDNYLEQYTNTIILEFKELFEHKSKVNLNNILKKWYENIDENVKLTVMSIETKKLFDYLNDLSTYDEISIMQNISYIVLGYYVEDWQDNTNQNFFNKIKSMLEEINNLKDVEVTEQEMVEISDGNKKVKKYINCKEITLLGKTLQNNIEDTLEEYGNSISEGEKIKILLQIIKKYM